LAELEQARKQQRMFDVLLIDLDMPGMSGLEFAQTACKDENLERRIVYMLVPQKKALDTTRGDALKAGTCLFKPVKPSGLLDALCAVLQGQTAASSSTAPPKVGYGQPERALRTLLAEDSLVNQKLTVAMLRKRGHDVVVANDGVEAVRAVEQHSFDLILMDIQMPEMDGYGATAAIRAREKPLGKHTPIIALTAHAMMGDRERCLQAGMDEYVTKPVRAEQLFDTIALVLRPAGIQGDLDKLHPAHPSVRIDWDRARIALDGDTHRLQTLVLAVIEMLPGLLASLEEAVQADDGARVQFTARTVVDTVRYLGVEPVMQAAFELERMGRDDRLQEAREQFPTFAKDIKSLQEACVAFIRSPSAHQQQHNAECQEPVQDLGLSNRVTG
jgi:CheY-like chemotaxis protein